MSSAFDVQVGGDHYKKLAIQPLEYILANGIPFPEGNIIKYVTRWRDKGGLSDLQKARHMLDFLIEHEEKAGNGTAAAQVEKDPYCHPFCSCRAHGYAPEACPNLCKEEVSPVEEWRCRAEEDGLFGGGCICATKADVNPEDCFYFKGRVR